MSRLYRDVVITEKIDGTNSAVVIKRYLMGAFVDERPASEFLPAKLVKLVFSTELDEGGLPLYEYHVFAQSRTRLIIPGDDNFGFAAWVEKNAEQLVETLGEGVHFGEWWGSGIQRGYGLKNGEKRFSLFNTERWGSLPYRPPSAGEAVTHQLPTHIATSLVYRVPILYTGPFDEVAIQNTLEVLREQGSKAASGWKGEGKAGPEGIVIYHTHARTMFKVTLENDAMSKGEAERRARA